MISIVLRKLFIINCFSSWDLSCTQHISSFNIRMHWNSSRPSTIHIIIQIQLGSWLLIVFRNCFIAPHNFPLAVLSLLLIIAFYFRLFVLSLSYSLPILIWLVVCCMYIGGLCTESTIFHYYILAFVCIISKWHWWQRPIKKNVLLPTSVFTFVLYLHLCRLFFIRFSVIVWRSDAVRLPCEWKHYCKSLIRWTEIDVSKIYKFVINYLEFSV